MQITKSKKIIIIILAIICFTIAAFVIFNKPQQAEASWWDDTWLYRKAVAVTNNTTAESNVYVAVTIADTDDLITAGKMQADCGDLRWTDYNGIVLKHYIVSDCNTASTLVHIELETFPAGAQTLYYYYGNPAATDGFEASDFSTVASNYTIVSTGTEENGPGPVGYWSFDEGYGDTAYDSTDNGNDGDLAGSGGSCPGAGACPSWQTEDMCVSGKCLHFDGDNDYVSVADNDSLDITSAITIEAWVKADALQSQAVLSKRSSDDAAKSQQLIYLKDDGTFRLYFPYSDASETNQYSTNTYSTGVWYHAVVVYLSSQYARLYINGELWSEDTSVGTALQASTSEDLLIGIHKDSIGDYVIPFNGSIDEVRIYPYARTAAQIKKDYNAGLAGLGGGTEGVGAALGGGGSQKWMTDGLVGFWKMDETSANTCSGSVNDSCDSSGNGNDGAWNADATSATGKFGNGVTFDGTGDYVDCGAGTSLNITETITISAWVKIDDDSVNRAIVSKIVGVTGSEDFLWQLTFRTANKKMAWYVTNTQASWDAYRFGDTVLNTDTWYHIVATFDGSDIHLYLNGALDDGTLTGTVPASLRTNTESVEIGRQEYSGGYYYQNGSIDAVRIYNRALSPKEVRDLYNFAPGPVLHLKMDEKVSGNAQTLYDISTNENNGTTYYGANTTGMDCTVPGKFGTACDFDGADDYVGVGDFNY